MNHHAAMWRDAALIAGFAVSGLMAAPVVLAEPTPLPPIYIERTLTLAKNDALTTTLIKAGLESRAAHALTFPLQRKVALHRLRPGHKITILYKEGKAFQAQDVISLTFIAPRDKIAQVVSTDDGYIAQVTDRPLVKGKAIAVGHIKGSLYQSAETAGLPDALVPAFANLFAYELDFTRDIRAGDLFRVVFEEVRDEEGRFVRSGNILAAELYARGKKRSAYRYKDGNGLIAYYDEKGRPKKKLLLRTPLEFSRISSHFNPHRKHPVLGYTRAHRGTDFAAPTGTPVKASGNGVIEDIGWKGAYGKYIRIRHNGTYKTAYAHLSRYARGMKTGQRVRQGQTIAYVGSTGRSTGPHLHYEVHVNNKAVNAMRARIPAGNPLPKRKISSFRQLVASLKQMWDGAEVQVAQAAQHRL
jgi:murein DD-endopeptidase MepM/ murein hydrolase activator NlpD